MSNKVIRISALRNCSFDIRLIGAKALPGGGHQMTIEQWQMAAQVRILQELEKLNALLACPNFINVPKTLREIKHCVGRIPAIARPRKPKVEK